MCDVTNFAVYLTVESVKSANRPTLLRTPMPSRAAPLPSQAPTGTIFSTVLPTASLLLTSTRAPTSSTPAIPQSGSPSSSPTVLPSSTSTSPPTDEPTAASSVKAFRIRKEGRPSYAPRKRRGSAPPSRLSIQMTMTMTALDVEESV